MSPGRSAHASGRVDHTPSYRWESASRSISADVAMDDIEALWACDFSDEDIRGAAPQFCQAGRNIYKALPPPALSGR